MAETRTEYVLLTRRFARKVWEDLDHFEQEHDAIRFCRQVRAANRMASFKVVKRTTKVTEVTVFKEDEL